jgi:hypothetical protein
MLNKKESLLRRDQAVSWLWACQKTGFNRDVARLIAKEVFDGFKYVNGLVRLPKKRRWKAVLQFEKGRLISNGNLPGWIYSDGVDDRRKPSVLCYAILLGMRRRKFILNGHRSTRDQADAIIEVLQDTKCGVEVKVRAIIGNQAGYHFCQTFGDVLRLDSSLNMDWCHGYRTDDDVDDVNPLGFYCFLAP